jgi:hypothetical protein
MSPYNSSVAIGHDPLDEAVFLIKHHVADVVAEIALFADVTGLATVVAGLCKQFEGSSAVDIHGDARRECVRRGVHCCRDRGGRGM